MSVKTITKQTKQPPKKGEPRQPEVKIESAPTTKPAELKAEGTPKPEPVKSTPKPEAAEPKLKDIKLILDALTATVLEHTQQIAELQETLARKRRPVASNGKVQIRDKTTGKVYPSKNNCYKSLLKAGELKDLVAQGIFGSLPEKNTFGWYALFRALPDRFEQIEPEQAEADGKS